MEETTFFSDGSIQITNTRAILGGKTYAMAQITSVSIGEIPPDKKAAGCLIVLGIPLLLVYGLGLILIIIGIILNLTAKPSYVVQIGSSSGEQKALISKDKAHIEKIVKAMNDAIIHRG